MGGLERRGFCLGKVFERFHIGSSIVLKINVNLSKSAVKWNYYPIWSLLWEIDINIRERFSLFLYLGIAAHAINTNGIIRVTRQEWNFLLLGHSQQVVKQVFFEICNFGKIGLLKIVSKWGISQSRDQYFKKILALVTVLTVLKLYIPL